MKKLMAVAAFAVALAGPLAFATDSSSPTQQTGLAASISPAYITPGGQVTVTSVQPCPLQAQGVPTQLYWSLGPGGLAGTVTTGVDGTWTVRFAAPVTPGVSPFIAYCAHEGRTTAMYNQLNFTIVARRPPVVTG